MGPDRSLTKIMKPEGAHRNIRRSADYTLWIVEERFNRGPFTLRKAQKGNITGEHTTWCLCLSTSAYVMFKRTPINFKKTDGRLDYHRNELDETLGVPEQKLTDDDDCLGRTPALKFRYLLVSKRDAISQVC
ncbi:hypothetical protein N7504_003328 [Penicillium tannophilum]|nr:hypothetical protein N7504_003328 [Penicillium tannophilum]